MEEDRCCPLTFFLVLVREGHVYKHTTHVVFRRAEAYLPARFTCLACPNSRPNASLLDVLVDAIHNSHIDASRTARNVRTALLSTKQCVVGLSDGGGD
jgi:hypothetical protein